MTRLCREGRADSSEHCRHKQFNASWTIDGEKKDHSLFSMIRNTHDKNPRYVVSAYSDNAGTCISYSTSGSYLAKWACSLVKLAAVLDAQDGQDASYLSPQKSGEWTQINERVLYVIKAETHNHPTAISPFPGAATGAGGEIRDEGVVGRGSRPKAGLTGFK